MAATGSVLAISLVAGVVVYFLHEIRRHVKAIHFMMLRDYRAAHPETFAED